MQKLWIVLIVACQFILPVRLAPAEEPLKVGVIAPLSGVAANYGTAIRNGIDLALEEISPAIRIRVFYEDFKFEPKLAVSAFRKLSEVDRVNVMIVIASTPSNAVAPLAEAKKIPMLAWASDTAVTKGRKYSLRTYPSGEAEGATTAAEALRRGFRKTAVFHVVSDYAASAQRGFVETFPRSEMVLIEEAPQELQDFRTFLARAKSAGAESFFLCLEVGQNGLFARQARELKLPAKFCGCENLNNLEELKISNGALNDAFFATVNVSEEFRLRYRGRFGNEDVLSGAAIHYDLIRLMNDKIRAEQSPESIIESLYAAGEIKGALPSARFVRTEDDQFLDVTLGTKLVSELAPANK